jgi:hypothetical protein
VKPSGKYLSWKILTTRFSSRTATSMPPSPPAPLKTYALYGFLSYDLIEVNFTDLGPVILLWLSRLGATLPSIHRRLLFSCL